MPNADVLAQPIVNYTRAELRRVELPIGISYNSDTEFVRTVILDEIKQVNGYVADPEPLVLFQTFGASSINLILFFWVNTLINSHVAARDDALIRIKSAFEKNGIEIPYPIQVQYNRTHKKPSARRKN